MIIKFLKNKIKINIDLYEWESINNQFKIKKTDRKGTIYRGFWRIKATHRVVSPDGDGGFIEHSNDYNSSFYEYDNNEYTYKSKWAIVRHVSNIKWYQTVLLIPRLISDKVMIVLNPFQFLLFLFIQGEIPSNKAKENIKWLISTSVLLLTAWVIWETSKQ